MRAPQMFSTADGRRLNACAPCGRQWAVSRVWHLAAMAGLIAEVRMLPLTSNGPIAPLRLSPGHHVGVLRAHQLFTRAAETSGCPP
jgi:hypothetical protein